MATYEQDLRISAAPSTRIRVIGVSSERRAEADRLRSRGHDAEADYQDEESGFLTLGAEIERMVTDRRRLRSRDIMHACHVHLREAHTTAVGTDPAVNVEEELVRLRRQLDRLSGFADERSALLAGFDEVLAALSGEIRATVMRTVPELEGLARAVDLTAVSAQHDLGHRLNVVLADVERTLDDLCRSYQQRASRQVMESLREHGFEMMLAAHEPAITRPDTADSRIDPVFAPREVSLADACLGAVHIVQRVVGARPELPDEGSRRVLAVVRQPVTGAVLQVAARSGPLAPAVLATGAAVLLAAGAREAALERARQALRFQVEEASHRLACFPSRYQEQIEQYATQVWKALGATEARLADHLAEEMARAERTLDAERRRAKSDDLAAEATRMLGARLRDDVRHLLARFDAAA
jgi:hypothetical protein